MLSFSELSDLIPLVSLYAETHYRFKYFPFSLYYRRLPEVVFDTPHRINPGNELPVFLMIKNSDKFPIKLEKITVRVFKDQTIIEKVFPIETLINTPWWYKILRIDVSEFPEAEIFVDAIAQIKNRKKCWNVHQDNYSGLCKSPFRVYKSNLPQPNFSGWTTGETHCHSEYGFDQVEFGAPLEIYKQSVLAMGIHWVALTDHSYNLDDLPENYLIDDPELKKWQIFLEHVKQLNQDPTGALLIPGEELTCMSKTGKNVHLLLIGQRNFLSGSGDSAQHWFKTKSELSVEEALHRVDNNAVALASHPFARVGWLERILIKRNPWSKVDLLRPKLNGWQIYNGISDRGFLEGLTSWIKEINSGRRITIFAGNDAHGNFNCFRQIKFPMVKLHQHNYFLFGKVTTRTFSNGKNDEDSILKAIKNGNSIISEGPALDIKLKQGGKIYSIGDCAILGSESYIILRYMSTLEYGKINFIKVFTSSRSREKIVTRIDKAKLQKLNPWQDEIEVFVNGEKYIRAEIETSNDNGAKFKAWTNPIWLSQAEVKL